LKLKDFKLFSFSDIDWGGSIDDMKSTYGYCFILGLGIFSWSSKKQEIVKFVVVSATVNQTFWLRKILIDLRQNIGVCSSKNQGGVLDIVLFLTAYKCT